MSNYRLNDEKMFADVTDGIAIIINSETGIYYGMNSLGTSIYENLVSGASKEDISKKLIELGAPSTIKDVIDEFIQVMVDKELIIEAQESHSEINIFKSIAENDNYVPTLKEYNDAQELLLADPIHEVKEETGWTPEKESIGYTKEETIEREKKMEV